jgi:hypothetical protein
VNIRLQQFPVITDVSYNGVLNSTTLVSIKGTNIASDTSLYFGINPIIYNRINDNTLICYLSVGNDYITLKTSYGTIPTAISYTIGIPPRITFVSYVGILNNVSLVTIEGTDFNADASLQFGTNTIIPINVNSNMITCRLPVGTGTIRVNTVNGESKETSEYIVSDTISGFPIITNVSYNGTLNNVSLVTITGLYFTANTEIYFGESTIIIPTIINDTTLKCNLPVGSDYIRVSTENGMTEITGTYYYTVVVVADKEENPRRWVEQRFCFLLILTFS